jgi:hypothetical protein
LPAGKLFRPFEKRRPSESKSSVDFEFNIEQLGNAKAHDGIMLKNRNIKAEKLRNRDIAQLTNI